MLFDAESLRPVIIAMSLYIAIMVIVPKIAKRPTGIELIDDLTMSVIAQKDAMASTATRIATLRASYAHLQLEEMRRLRTQNAEPARDINQQSHEIEQLRQSNEIDQQTHEIVGLRQENESPWDSFFEANQARRLTLHQVRVVQKQEGIVNAFGRAYYMMVRIAHALGMFEDEESEGERGD